MKLVIDEILVEATILGMMSEAASYEDFGKNKMPGIGNKPITIHSALSYKSHDDFSQRQDKQKVYMDAIQNLQGGIESGDIKRSQVPDEYSDEVKRKSPEPKQDDDADKKDSARGDQASGDTDISGPDSVVADDPPTDDKTKTKKGESKLNSPNVVQGANEIAERKNKLSNKQIEIEKDKKQFMTNMVDAMLQETSIPKGAGKYTMSRDDFDVYKSYLEGNKPEVPNIEVPDEELDAVFDNIKERLGPKGYNSFISKAKGAGAPPPDVKTDVARALAVVRSYISTGGISVISGERIPFYDTQLDHVVSLANGGVDGGDNWQWMEARYNQFKLEFTDEVLLGKITNELEKSPEEDRLKLLQSEYKNYARNSMVDFFKRSGYSSLTAEDVLGAKGEAGVQLVKAVAETAGISRYKYVPGGDGGGSRTRGGALPMSVLKEKIVKELKLQPKSAKTKVDEEFAGIINELAKQQGEIGTLKTSIKKQKSDKKESVMYDHIQGLLEMASRV